MNSGWLSGSAVSGSQRGTMEGTGRSMLGVGVMGDTETDKRLPPCFLQEEASVCQYASEKQLTSLS